MNPETTLENPLTPSNLISNSAYINQQDLDLYRHFLQLFIQQQETLRQVQTYMCNKYQVPSPDMFDIQDGRISRDSLA